MLSYLMLFLSFFSTISYGLDDQENCDLIGKNLRSKNGSDLKSCYLSCENEAQCKGAVFISGWNKCFLKKEIKSQHEVMMISGLKNKEFKVKHDFSGKDYKKKVLDSAKACSQACSGEAKCVGFTYIKGYRTCWLKRTSGRIFPKVFHCTLKKIN